MVYAFLVKFAESNHKKKEIQLLFLLTYCEKAINL